MAAVGTRGAEMKTFVELVQSRRHWIDSVLRPWCRAAPRAELVKAEAEWEDIAGRAAPEFTLWLWAWERFPVLYVEGMRGVEETYPVRVTLTDGTKVEGYPDSKQSRRGQLFISQEDGSIAGPFAVDAIAAIERRGH